MTTSAKLIKDGRVLVVRVPFVPQKRRGRKLVVAPEGSTWTPPRPVIDCTIVKALARAHRWKAMLESGEYASVTELAAAEKINLSYLCRVLRLTLLTPDIVETILYGRQPVTLQLFHLLAPLPVIWTEQHIALMT